MTHSFTPTAEQTAIVTLGTTTHKSFAVVARAGAAKTTTLELLVEKIPQSESVLAVAFNKKIATEMVEKFPANIDVRTMNGLGHRAWGSTLRRKLSLDKQKSGRLITETIERQAQGDPDRKAELDTLWSPARALLDVTRNAGLVPKGTRVKPSKRLVPDTPEEWERIIAERDIECEDEFLTILLAREALLTSIEESFSGIIDFTDQIYMPTLFGGNFKRYDTVLVDEAQDLSPINHHMISLSVKFGSKGRVIAVGDPFQSIYGFRGAASGSMSLLIEKYSMEILPLTTTFRCAQRIVEEAQTRAPDLRAAEWAEEGEVRWHTFPHESFGPDLFPRHEVAILCRNNAPLISIALRLIRAKRGVTMLGGNLFSELRSIMTKVCPQGDMSADVAFARLDSWRSKELAKLRALSRDALIAKREDQFECLIALFDSSSAETVSDALRYLSDLETRSGEITLATGHKSKGLEWDEVFILDPWRVPSRYAIRARDNGNPEQLEQEQNLLYVMQTRARKRLTYINLDQFIIDGEDA